MSKTTGTKSHYRPAHSDQPAYPVSLIRGILILEERPVITDSGCADDQSEHIVLYVLPCPGSGIFFFFSLFFSHYSCCCQQDLYIFTTI